MQFRLSIKENDEVVGTVVQETDKNSLRLPQAIEVFRTKVNELFTKKLLETGGQDLSLEADDVSTEDEDDFSPKKKKR